MATFEAQVEALTGISIDGSSNPTQTELSLFLVDGVKDVIHRMIRVKPEELVRFTSTTNSTSSIAKVGKVLTVAREHDSTTILRKCTKINPGDRYEATNIDSLKYRSKYSPGFYELNGSIYTVPEAGSGNNDIVVTQIFYDTGVAFGDEVPDNFPESYAYLVALYAGIKSLQNALSAIDISTFSLASVPPDVPTLGSSSVTITGTAPTYDNTIASSEFGDLATLIDTEEDTELAAAKLQEISTLMQNELNEFNQESVEYQATLQKDLKDADFDNEEDARKVQKYQAEIAEYSAEVAAASQKAQGYINTAQGYANEITSKISIAQAYTADVQARLSLVAPKVSEFQAKMQDAMNTFNDANVEYQATLQKNLQDATMAAQEAQKEGDMLLQAKIQDYSLTLQRYSAEVTNYQAEVTTQVQEQTTQVTQYQLLYTQLKAEYEAGFVVPGGGE